jgi:hypothetical protein
MTAILSQRDPTCRDRGGPAGSADLPPRLAGEPDAGQFGKQVAGPLRARL